MDEESIKNSKNMDNVVFGNNHGVPLKLPNCRIAEFLSEPVTVRYVWR